MTKAEKINMVMEGINWNIENAEEIKADVKRRMIEELRRLADLLEKDKYREVSKYDFSWFNSRIEDYERANNELNENKKQKKIIEFLTKED